MSVNDNILSRLAEIGRHLSRCVEYVGTYTFTRLLISTWYPYLIPLLPVRHAHLLLVFFFSPGKLFFLFFFSKSHATSVL